MRAINLSSRKLLQTTPSAEDIPRHLLRKPIEPNQRKAILGQLQGVAPNSPETTRHTNIPDKGLAGRDLSIL